MSKLRSPHLRGASLPPFVLSEIEAPASGVALGARPSTSLRTNGFGNRRFSAGFLIAALLTAQSAQAERPACIHPHDMRTLIRIALPDAVEALAARCRTALPDDAFLPNEGSGLAARYRHEAPVDPARARAAIEAATGQDLSSFASNDTMFTIARGLVDDQIERRVPVKDCKTIDSLLALAGELPADTMAEAILLALEVAGPEQTKGLAICRPKDDGADR